MRSRRIIRRNKKDVNVAAIVVLAAFMLLGTVYTIGGTFYQIISMHPGLAVAAILAVGVAGTWLLRIIAHRRSSPRDVLPIRSSWTVRLAPTLTIKGERQCQQHLQVLAMTFEGAIRPVPLLTGGECAPFYAAMDAIEALRPATERWHVHAQVSMGEFLETSFHMARPTFNSKRVDLLICNRFGMPMLVIEHQGGGHINVQTTNEDQLRNEVKHAVLGKAGVSMLATPAGISTDDARDLIVDRLKDLLESGRVR